MGFRYFVFLFLVMNGLFLFLEPVLAEDRVIILPTAPPNVTSWAPKIGLNHIHTQASRHDTFDPDHAPTGTMEQIIQSVLARRKWPIHYLGFSDHPKFSAAEWDRQWVTRGKYSQGDSLCVEMGSEWTYGGIADPNVCHVCVMGTAHPFATSTHADLIAIVCPTFRDLLISLGSYRDYTSNGYAVFAHPWAGRFHFGDFDKNFLSPAAWQTVREKFALIEVAGGESQTTATCSAGEPYYQRALAQGWWVAPAYGVDNFANEFRLPSLGIAGTVIWIPPPAQLNHGMLHQAILKRFVSVRITDHTAILVGKSPRDKDHWLTMGDTIVRHGRESVEYGFRVETPYLVKLVLVGVRSTGDIIEIPFAKRDLARRRTGDRLIYEGTVKFVPHANDVCYYLRVVGSAGTVVGLTAPLWIDHQPAIAPPRPPETAWERWRLEPTDRIILKPRQRVTITVSRQAALAQAYRLTYLGTVIRQGMFTADHERVSFEYTNPTDREHVLGIEAFAHHPNGQWQRSLRYHEEQSMFSSTAQVGFEDGQDNDCDDLLVECEFH